MAATSMVIHVSHPATSLQWSATHYPRAMKKLWPVWHRSKQAGYKAEVQWECEFDERVYLTTLN
jgi:G:T-mismatch repair DNA endonuclease (very short patch repair protein)